MKEKSGVAVPLQQAEKTLRILRKLRLVDSEFEFKEHGQELLIPLRHHTDADIAGIREHCPDAKLRNAIFDEARKKRPRNLAESLRGKISEKLLPSLPRSSDVLGDIAIIDLSESLIEYSAAVGRGVLEVSPHLRLVLRKSGSVTGPFRTRRFETIAGSGSTETFHREYSCVFHLDIAKVYFNPRLSNERMRIAQQVTGHERVVDMFAGVGPYSILIAKRQETSRITAIDMNRDAFRYLKENILANGVADRVMPILGDARTAISRGLQRTATRVIMNLPSDAIEFLEAAAQAVRSDGGMIHFYTFASRTDDLDALKESVTSVLERCGRQVASIPFCRIIREIAPNRVHVAIDIELR